MSSRRPKKESWESELPTINSLGRLVLDRPLVVFDLETTGLSKRTGRIIEFGALKVFPDIRKAPREYRYLINPGTPISRHSTAVHKIRDADVRQQPHFCERASTILEIFRDADILGFNSNNFDIPFLEAELQRCNPDIVFPPEGSRQIDAMKIYHSREPAAEIPTTSGCPKSHASQMTGYSAAEGSGWDTYDTADSRTSASAPDGGFAGLAKPRKEKRDLTSALRLYAGLSMKNAHSALADADATLRILIGQLDRYPDLPGDVQGLHDSCALKPAAKARRQKAKPQPSPPDATDALADRMENLAIASSEPSVPKGAHGRQQGRRAKEPDVQPQVYQEPPHVYQEPLQAYKEPPMQPQAFQAGGVRWPEEWQETCCGDYGQSGWGETIQFGEAGLQTPAPQEAPQPAQRPPGRPSRSNGDSKRSQREHLSWETGFAVFAFGKYRQQTVDSVAVQDPSYLEWILRQGFPVHVQQVVHDALQGYSTACN